MVMNEDVSHYGHVERTVFAVKMFAYIRST